MEKSRFFNNGGLSVDYTFTLGTKRNAIVRRRQNFSIGELARFLQAVWIPNIGHLPCENLIVIGGIGGICGISCTQRRESYLNIIS